MIKFNTKSCKFSVSVSNLLEVDIGRQDGSAH